MHFKDSQIREGILLCLVGPTGSGKTSLGSMLLDNFKGTLSLSISLTTRNKRKNEVNGESYFFVSKEEFARKIDQGEFFEYEKIHGNYYGTLKSTIVNAIDGGKDLLLDIDIKGALNIKKHYSNNTVVVFLTPPDFSSLKERVMSRSAMNDKEFNARLATATEEYRAFKDAIKEGKIDYFIVNKNKKTSFYLLSSILEAERTRASRYKSGYLNNFCSIADGNK